jgi:DNA helicase-2/ATP-dependent DNA helicase PcrA
MLASPADIEEERRLFYVALTRAQVSVDLSFAQTRMRNGKHDSNPPSRFIREIDPKYLANPLSRDDFRARPSAEDDTSPRFGGFGSRFNPGSQQRGGYAPKPVQPKPSMPRPSVPQADRSVPDKDFIPMSVLEMEPGMRIEHNRFGFGVIREITGDPQKRMATIVFDKYGEKKLLLQWAKMRKA